MDFISQLEVSLDLRAKKNLLPMQAGDVAITWADTSLLEDLTGYKPATEIADGVSNFVKWYREYYNV